VRHPFLIIAAIFTISFLVIKSFLGSQATPAAPAGDSGSIAPGSGMEGETGDVRLTALRQELDNAGYSDVHFRMNGGVLEVWGSVPAEVDRLQVQVLIVANGIRLIDDAKLRARDTFAEP
jgi:hypothetical protein